MHNETTIRKLQQALAHNTFEKLSDTERELWDQIDFADTQIRKLGYTKARKLIANRYKVSHEHARKVTQTAGVVFGTEMAINKDHIKSIVVDSLLAALSFCLAAIDDFDEKETAEMPEAELILYNAAKRAHRSDVMKSNIGRQIAQISDQLRKATGFDLNAGEGEMWAGVEQHIIMMTGNPEAAGLKKIEGLEEYKREILEKINGNDVQDAQILK
jgi:hypothetical protein